MAVRGGEVGVTGVNAHSNKEERWRRRWGKGRLWRGRGEEVGVAGMKAVCKSKSMVEYEKKNKVGARGKENECGKL